MKMPEKLAQRLTVKHLRLIAAIAEHRQLSLAAQVLALTQPAASRTLGEIEALCGDALFERHPRGMTLTPTGELMARRARNVLEEIAEAAEEVARHRAGRGGTVRIGAVTGGAIGYIVPVVRALKALAPDAEVHVEVGMSRELIRDLRALQLDFVLARIPPDIDAREFDVVRASEERIDLLVGAGHPLAGSRSVRLTELLDFDWVMQARGAPIRMAIEDAIVSAGARLPQRVTNTSSLLVTIAMLAAPDTVAPVSREVADLLVGAGPRPGILVLPLAERIVVAPYLLLSTRGRRLSPVAQRCHEMVAEMLRHPSAPVAPRIQTIRTAP
jgi:DNA-binding transcriptional LysR family regulator